MNELLQKLLASEVLTEDTRKELETAFKTKIDEEVKKARDEATVSVTAELNEKWVTERDTLIEALDAQVSKALTEELSELKEDIERFRDLEAEYAEKLVEAKGEMATQLKKDMETLVERLDTFLEVRLAKEIEELKEDIEAERQKRFGRKVFEAFVEEYKQFAATDDSVEGKLNETEQRLADTLAALEAAEKKNAKMERAAKMETVLKPLSGRSREVMEAILKSVDTTMLEEGYKTYIGRVLKETVAEPATETKPTEKEDKVLAEGKSDKAVKGNVVTGDDTQQITETEALDKPVSKISDEDRNKLRKLAGIK